MLRKLAWILFVTTFCSAVSFAQSTLGTLLGTVTDQSGGVISNATVKITNTDEGTSRTFTADPNGNYEAVNSKPGRYSIEVGNPGFQTSKVDGVELGARQTLRMDVTLRVGLVTQQVEVSATTAGVITTETETVASTYNTLQISNLPTNFRASGQGNSPFLLLSLLPGVQADSSGNLTIQGGLQNQSQFSVDGISTTDVTHNNPLTNAFPSAESLAEIKVQGVGSPAEFGDPGDVTTVSKSGTNTLHGGVFWYHQNAALDAIPYGASKKPSKIANDFGGSAGGPVVIPHVYDGRNKSFFFGTYERFRLPRTGVVQDTVPTADMRQGNLSYLCSAGFSASGVCNDRDPKTGNVIDQIYDPYTGQPYARNQITEAMNAATAKILSLYPTPNRGSTFTSNNYNVNSPANYDSTGFDARGDQYFGPRLSVFGRFTFKNVNQLTPQGLTLPSSTNYEHVRMLVTSATYTLRPTLVDEFRFGYTNDLWGNANSFAGQAFSNTLGLQNIEQSIWFNGLTDITFSGIMSGLGGRLNAHNQSRTREFTDNLAWLKGRHTLKFGVDMRTIRAVTISNFYGADNYGSFGFYGHFTGNDFADFYLGIPSESDLDNVPMDNDGRSRHWAAFAQDSFRVSPRLTLEYGVRWEYHPAYTDAGGYIGNFDNTVPRSGRAIYPTGFADVLAPTMLQSFDACPTSAVPATATDPTSINGAPCTPVLSAAQAGLPEGLRTIEKTRFMPRFGFAYKPFHNDKTVVRGGIGSYTAATLGDIYYSLTGVWQAYTNTYTNTLVNNTPAYVWPQTSNIATLAGVPNYGTAYVGTANDIHWKDPYSLQWNLSVEHNLGLSTGLRMSYLGMKTTQLSWSPNWNQSLPNSTTDYPDQPLSSRPFPNFGRVNTRAIGAIAKYNALQIEANRRMATGLTFDSTYTWLWGQPNYERIVRGKRVTLSCSE